MDQPIFHWFNTKMRTQQTIAWFHENWDIPKNLKKAIHEAEKALHTYKETLLLEGQKY